MHKVFQLLHCRLLNLPTPTWIDMQVPQMMGGLLALTAKLWLIANIFSHAWEPASMTTHAHHWPSHHLWHYCVPWNRNLGQNSITLRRCAQQISFGESNAVQISSDTRSGGRAGGQASTPQKVKIELDAALKENIVFRIMSGGRRPLLLLQSCIPLLRLWA